MKLIQRWRHFHSYALKVTPRFAHSSEVRTESPAMPSDFLQAFCLPLRLQQGSDKGVVTPVSRQEVSFIPRFSVPRVVRGAGPPKALLTGRSSS
ncbi:hypothetical protein KCP70_11445 [Salmonella enterica subsp. enterica]|nr:hypothetical protein KCP70_11445 [Salmonella enterica subsp. enterica]